jgi:hypothetical protein
MGKKTKVGSALTFGLFDKKSKGDTASAIERPSVALLADMPQYEEAAKRATASRLAEIERVMPGATAQREQASDIISSWMRAELSKDAKEQAMRSWAEFGGAGFNPATAGRAGGFQMAKGVVPRQLGLQAQQLQEKGMSAALTWGQLADSFAYDAFEAANPAQVSMQYGVQKANAQARDEQIYQQAVANQQSAIVGGLTGLASIALAPAVAPALFGGLASGASALGLGTAGTATQLGTGLSGSLFNIGAGRAGTGLAAGAAMPKRGWFPSAY